MIQESRPILEACQASSPWVGFLVTVGGSLLGGFTALLVANWLNGKSMRNLLKVEKALREDNRSLKEGFDLLAQRMPTLIQQAVKASIHVNPVSGSYYIVPHNLEQTVASAYVAEPKPVNGLPEGPESRS